MTITEYTAQRAEILRKTKLSETDSPANMRILWFEIIGGADDARRIYSGMHSHSFFEIHYVFGGKTVYTHGTEQTELRTGEALIIPPNTQHRYIGCDDEILKLSVAFSLDRDLPVAEPFFGLKTQKFSFADDIAENTDHVLKLSETNDIFVPYLINGRITEIIYSAFILLKFELPSDPQHENDLDPRLSVAKEYICNNKHRMLSCEDVAKECCLSAKQLSRIFKNHTGKSLFEYIKTAKLNYAKNLLIKNNYSVKEISFMLGFENECSFVSFFKRHCGMPPTAFRLLALRDKSEMSEN